MGVSLLTAILLVPLINLLVSGIGETTMPTWSIRHVVLMGRSLTFATSSVGIAMGIGCLSALYSFNRKGSILRTIDLLVIGFAFVPNYVYAMVWMRSFWTLNRVLRFTSFSIPTQGLATSIWVQAMTWLPLCFILVRVALSSLDPVYLEASTFMGREHKPMQKIVIPMIMPSIRIGFWVLWVLTLFDYTVPSLFAENVYVMEIYLDFTTHYNVTVPLC